MNDEAVEKFLSEKTKKKVGHAVDNLRITPDQARASGALGQVGTTTGSLVGTIVGAGVGAAVKHPGQGAFLGAGIGAAAGGGVGAAAGLYGARPKKRKKTVASVVTKNAHAIDPKNVRNSALGFSGGAASMSAFQAARSRNQEKKAVFHATKSTNAGKAAANPGLDNYERAATHHGSWEHASISRGAVRNSVELARASRASRRLAIGAAGVGLAAHLASTRDGDGDGKLNEKNIKKVFDEAQHRREQGRFAVKSGMTEAPGSQGISPETQRKIGTGLLGLSTVANVSALRASYDSTKHAVKPTLEGLSRIKRARKIAGYTGKKIALPLAAADVTAGVLATKLINDKKKEHPVAKFDTADEVFTKARDSVAKKWEPETKHGLKQGAGLGAGFGAGMGAVRGVRLAGEFGVPKPVAAASGALGGAARGAVLGGGAGAGVGAIQASNRKKFAPKKLKKPSV